MRWNYLAIEGNIGAGKSTLASRLSGHYMADILEEEFEDNPLLPAFYRDPSGFGFPLEISFLIDRYRQLVKGVRPGNRVISDFWFDKSMVFGGVNLKGEKLAMFKSLFLELKTRVPKPDLVLYYHREIEKVKEGIQFRGREYEKAIEADYLKRVEKGFMAYLKKEKNVPLLLIPGENFSPGRDREHLLRLVQILDRDFKPGINEVSGLLKGA